MTLKRITPSIYQVKDGENLKILSEKFKIESTKILLDNNISPKQIKPGILLSLKK